ncbi:protein kinase [uncultured Thiohalocapsa sp.]|uniref:protein kinase domain-containing protein n=1 Tax=uncultured Thiohalocapsa sp. TaxID=768990 RepID=UPI0025D6E6B1|nr:protein kinase [uncultured Thiohalocapsa sp.]
MPAINAAADLCPGCFAAPATAGAFAVCGHDPRAPRPVAALPAQAVLNGQFIVGRVLGKPGGFGITYLGLDQQLRTAVAIKEYLPRDLAMRGADGTTVVPQSAEEDQLFRYGLAQFLEEARTLAKLDHPNIVRVRQFFAANGSAYLVMDYYHGLSLAEYLARQRDGRLPEQTALELIQPILDGLRTVHAKGFLHRDIKPGNIYLARTDAGGVRPILLDFGAARSAVGERSHSLSVVLSEGYAPFEQYHRKGAQGPWSDVYATAAVLYRTITGTTPPSATERMSADTLADPATLGVSPGVAATLRRALALTPTERPQSAQELQQSLRGERDGHGGGDSGQAGESPRGLDGPPIQASDHSPANRARLRKAYAAVIGPQSTEHYLERFERFEHQPPLARIRWHWPAFFFNVFWLLYRRMWLTALVLVFVALTVVGFAMEIAAAFTSLSVEQTGTVAYLTSSVIFNLVLPMYAHALYYDHARRQIARSARRHAGAKAQLKALRAKGGTNMIVVWLIIVVPIIGFIGATAILSYLDYQQQARFSYALPRHGATS